VLNYDIVFTMCSGIFKGKNGYIAAIAQTDKVGDLKLL